MLCCWEKQPVHFYCTSSPSSNLKAFSCSGYGKRLIVMAFIIRCHPYTHNTLYNSISEIIIFMYSYYCAWFSPYPATMLLNPWCKMLVHILSPKSHCSVHRVQIQGTQPAGHLKGPSNFFFLIMILLSQIAWGHQAENEGWGQFFKQVVGDEVLEIAKKFCIFHNLNQEKVEED